MKLFSNSKGFVLYAVRVFQECLNYPFLGSFILGFLCDAEIFKGCWENVRLCLTKYKILRIKKVKLYQDIHFIVSGSITR